MRNLCKKGLPSGNVFEYAAREMLKYEKLVKRKELKAKTDETINSFLGKIVSLKFYSFKKDKRKKTKGKG